VQLGSAELNSFPADPVQTIAVQLYLFRARSTAFCQAFWLVSSAGRAKI